MKKVYLVTPIYEGVKGLDFSVDIEFPSEKEAKKYGDENFPDIYKIDEVVKDRKLLFIDIMGRIPYGTKFRFELGKNDFKTISFNEDPELPHLDEIYSYWVRKGFILPYLRPLSSMTEEEIEELDEMSFQTKTGSFKNYIHLTPNFTGFLGKVKFDPKTASPEISGICIADVIRYINWLNEHHFDYRGLIEKGLAIEAPKDMYV